MVMKRISCFTLVMLLACSLLAFPVCAYEEGEEASSEIYLEAEPIGDNRYAYRNEQGEIIAIMEDITDVEVPPTSARATIWGIKWTLKPSEKKYDSARPLDSLDGVQVYVDIDFSTTGDSYIGFYVPSRDEYYWFDNVGTSGFQRKLTIYSVNPIYLAIENSSRRTITYTGRYSLDEF